MLVSLQNILDKSSGKRAALPVLLTIVYLLAVFYSLSHVHRAPEHSAHSPAVHFPAAQLLISTMKLTQGSDDLSGNWQSDHQHTHGCSLMAQVAASLPGQLQSCQSPVVYRASQSLVSPSLPVPFRKKIRAPPLFRA